MADEVPLFERCGNTDFWKPKDQTNDDMEVTFVDPVGMVVLTTGRKSENRLWVLRAWFEDFYAGIFDALETKLPPKESEALSVWIRTIMENVPKLPKKKVLREFANMHPEAQRLLISGILNWLSKISKGWKGDRRDVASSDLSGLWKLLNSAGIHEC